jgi:hypothetical protein
MISAAAVAVINSQLLEPFIDGFRLRTLGEHLDDDSLNSGIGEAQVCGNTGSRGGAAIEPIGPEPSSGARLFRKCNEYANSSFRGAHGFGSAPDQRVAYSLDLPRV